MDESSCVSVSKGTKGKIRGQYYSQIFESNNLIENT